MRPTLKQLRDRRGKQGGLLRSLIRRMAIIAHDGAEWVLEGYEDHDGNVEREVAEPFGVAGVYSRPGSIAAQAIVAQVGAKGGHAVIIATASRELLALLTGGVAAGETGLLNEQVALRLRPDGTIEAASHGGAGVALATKADLDAVIEAYNLHIHGGGTLAGALTDVPETLLAAADGTSVLRGE